MKKEKRKNPHLFFWILVIVLIILFLSGVYLGFFKNFLISGKVVADSVPLAIYVSNSGSDSNDGTIDRPFLTLDAARAKIRQLKLSGELTSDINVYLREGIYFLNETFRLDERDSGSNNVKITYWAYPGEKVVISGGKILNNSWQLYSGNIYSMHVDSSFNSLFYGFDRLTRARTPNSGFYTGTSSSSATDKKYAFNFVTGNIRSDWRNLQDVEIISYILWEQNRFKINTISGNKVNVAGGMNPAAGNNFASDYSQSNFRYYVENVFEGLDSPGEWYLDKSISTLYYWPRSTNELNGTFIVPVVNQLVDVSGKNNNYVNNTVFQNLIFSHTDWFIDANGYKGSQAGLYIYSPSAIVFNYTNNCQFKNNVITLIGAYALESNSQNLDISGNELFNLGAGGIRVGRENKYPYGNTWPDSMNSELLVATNNSVTNNKIHDIGQIYKEGVGVWVGLSGYNNLANNLIYNTSYSGISVGWKWGQSDTPAKYNVIQRNIVHDVMRELNDGAAIYTLGKQPNTVIKYNLLYNVVRTPLHSLGVCTYCLQGIHMDEGSGLMTVHNNIIYNTFNGMVLNVGSGDVIQNNLFAYQSNYVVFWNLLNTNLGQNRFEGNTYYGLSGSLKFSDAANDATFQTYSLTPGSLPSNIFTDTSRGPQYGVSVNLDDYKFLFTLQNSLSSSVILNNTTVVTPPSTTNNSFEDSDNDGTIDNLDRCALTSSNISVNNYGCPVPVWNNFKDYSTKIENQDLNSVPNFNVSNPNGGILFSESVSLLRQNSPIDLDGNIHIEKNKISLNSNNLPELNKSAIILFYNITVISPKILIDGRDCFECTILSYDGSTMKVSVPHFSTFEVIESSIYNASSANNSNYSTCAPNWNCDLWSNCENSLRTRNCVDLNNCNFSANGPSTSEGCSIGCIADWKCSAWGSCLNQVQTRTCSLENSCSSPSQKPLESRECRAVSQVLSGSSNYLIIFIIIFVAVVLAIIYSIYRYYSLH